MKTSIVIILILAFLFTGCEKDEIEIDKKLAGEFCMLSDDEIILTTNDFEYYDFSSHLIYLKDHKSFGDDFQDIGAFKVLVDNEEIYSGQTWPGYSSSMPFGPVIHTHPSFFGDYIIPIGFIQHTDSLGNTLPDPRGDERIVDALKKYDQFHAGLSCEIKSVQYVSSKNVKVELLLKNNDSFNYYYLDPEKTGTGLFHYFTNGLFLINPEPYQTYSHEIGVVSADPWNTWKKDWLSVIKGNESKTITIRYNNFESVPNGKYKATFQFPGLSYQVEKKDIAQKNGQIWLGNIIMSKEVTIQ